MKKAVIECGGVQHLVAKGDELMVDFLGEGKKTVSFTPLMIVDGKDSIVDEKKLSEIKISAKVVEESAQGDKVVALRYKPKKRVHTKKGHRQKLTKLQITTV